MIICPYCQFNNPTEHKFCQSCGSPLQLWRALILPGTSSVALLASSLSMEGSQSDHDDADIWQQVTENQVMPMAADAVGVKTAGDWLGSGQRYRLVEDLSLSTDSQKPMEVQVTDTKPNDMASSLLEQRQQFALVSLEAATDETQLLPLMAYPYLALHGRFFPSLPELQQAWIEPNYSVLILEDRRHLPDLLTIWQQATLDPLQQVHSFYVMVELWEAMASFKGQGSLLNISNLCMDEDQIVCLRCIEMGPYRNDYRLADMGLLWQSLLQSNEQSLADLIELAAEVTEGKVDELDLLKETLVAIADRYQLGTDISTTPSETTPSANVLEDLDIPGLEGIDLTEDAGMDSIDSPTMVLPMKLTGLEDAGQSHVGQQRDHNEDNYFIQSSLSRKETLSSQTLDARCAYILCDGMGGHSGGEIASQLAVDTLHDYLDEHWQTELPNEPELRQAISLTNQVIYDKNQVEERTGSARMGTTLVMLLVKGTQAVAAHVGDSRLYRYTKRLGLQQITVDHEVGQREIKRGVEPSIAYARPDAYQLTQALGPCGEDALDPSFNYLNLTEDTLLLLCSDGLSDDRLLETHCSTHIEPILRGHKGIEEGVADLIELANEHNGHDNITALVVKLKVKPDLSKLQSI
ncbi:serine/threonine phosphatase [Leptothoe spongobia]|uniref:Serine/threonine phosphatase n=1 Tax=Leptothoe spongobia TAU-MAC 1115 TaxID=1967444 RepID=A0A947GIN1_9CYAN|nr:serine/threonine phosphatase [Leptothoe spongobia]MBT9316360.1 serine/threonine phosphatase [Leptothoe spongobia TAU-MAC 1115]